MQSNVLEERAAEMKKRMQLERNEKRAANLTKKLQESALYQSRLSRILSSMPSGAHRIQWNADQLARASGPLVYIAWGDRDAVMYVGMSGRGLYRVLDKTHHVLGKMFDKIVAMDFICCPSLKDAAKLEKQLIRAFEPAYNTVGCHTFASDPKVRWINGQRLKLK